MRKSSVIVMVVTAIWMMASCGVKTNQAPFDDGDSADIANADPTVYGVCGEETAMNTLQLVTDMGDTLSIDLTDAQDKDMVKGGLQVGDRMAVVPTNDKKAAVLVINQATLLGNWVMPNPLDGSDEVGICIKEGGIAESISHSDIVYKTWRLVRGQLELIMSRETGSGEDETLLYDIVKLGPDSLMLRDGDETLEYSRPKPKEEYGKDVKLEGSSIDDFQI